MKSTYNRLKTGIALASMLVLIACQDQPEPRETAHYDVIDSLVDSIMQQEHIPGFSIGIVVDSTLRWSKSYGESNVQAKKPMDVNSIMSIGSISKTFTSVAVMQLWEKGQLALDADINSYLDFAIRNPNHPEQPITIFQLLTHTASILDGKAYAESYSCGDPTLSLHDWIYATLHPEGQYFSAGENFAAWSPGTERRYSNIAFGLLGLIVETVSGQPFNQYCRTAIFEPLGMRHTGWYLSEVDTSNYIRPYGYVTSDNREGYRSIQQLFPAEKDFAAGTLLESCLYSFPNYPDGLVRTSVTELSYFMSAIMNGGSLHGKRILSKATIDKMLTPQLAGNNSQGLCFYAETINDSLTLWGHNGLDPGVRTTMHFHPLQKYGVITFQNNPTDGVNTVLKALYPLLENN